jgi:hypothetical protein
MIIIADMRIAHVGAALSMINTYRLRMMLLKGKALVNQYLIVICTILV